MGELGVWSTAGVTRDAEGPSRKIAISVPHSLHLLKCCKVQDRKEDLLG